MNVLALTIIATAFYAGFQIFSRLAGGKIDGFLVPIIINLVAVFIPLFVYVQQKAKKSKN
jgi:hypothetical protein